MASGKTPPKKRPRKLKAGRRTARTSGISQSAFAGYGTQQPSQQPAQQQVPPAAKPTSEAKKETD